MNQFESHVIATLIDLDKFANGLTGGNPQQTISYRAAVDAKAGGKLGTVLCDLLDEIQPGHCEAALKAGS